MWDSLDGSDADKCHSELEDVDRVISRKFHKPSHVLKVKPKKWGTTQVTTESVTTQCDLTRKIACSYEIRKSIFAPEVDLRAWSEADKCHSELKDRAISNKFHKHWHF